MRWMDLASVQISSREDTRARYCATAEIMKDGRHQMAARTDDVKISTHAEVLLPPPLNFQANTHQDSRPHSSHGTGLT